MAKMRVTEEAKAAPVGRDGRPALKGKKVDPFKNRRARKSGIFYKNTDESRKRQGFSGVGTGISQQRREREFSDLAPKNKVAFRSAKYDTNSKVITQFMKNRSNAKAVDARVKIAEKLEEKRQARIADRAARGGNGGQWSGENQPSAQQRKNARGTMARWRQMAEPQFMYPTVPRQYFQLDEKDMDRLKGSGAFGLYNPLQNVIGDRKGLTKLQAGVRLAGDGFVAAQKEVDEANAALLKAQKQIADIQRISFQESKRFGGSLPSEVNPSTLTVRKFLKDRSKQIVNMKDDRGKYSRKIVSKDKNLGQFSLLKRSRGFGYQAQKDLWDFAKENVKKTKGESNQELFKRRLEMVRAGKGQATEKLQKDYEEKREQRLQRNREYMAKKRAEREAAAQE